MNPCSRSQCFLRFKQYTGVSPVTYINDYRFAKAASLVANTAYNVTGLCFACGFSDISYFVKLFRKKFGVPPLQHKKRLLG